MWSSSTVIGLGVLVYSLGILAGVNVYRLGVGIASLWIIYGVVSFVRELRRPSSDLPSMTLF